MCQLSRIRRYTRSMFTGLTAVGWEPPHPGSTLTDVRPSLKHLHHLNVLLRLSVSSPYCA
ncbi:unnamed protein product [Staurois parvus]|uniref:Uncharacterized protein n=1 Tax=Staurois parvus TaxID=386267 RepID=A0ABN9E4S4_9NEOB|nr:unnamed protein product [Staurois parvus]